MKKGLPFWNRSCSFYFTYGVSRGFLHVWYMYRIYPDIWWEILKKKRLECEGVQLIWESLIKSKMPLLKTIVFFPHSIKTPFTVDFFEIGLKRAKKRKESFALLYKTGMGVWRLSDGFRPDSIWLPPQSERSVGNILRMYYPHMQ